LLAGRVVYPEYCFTGRGPLEQIVDELEQRLFDADVRREVALGMDNAAARLGPPGACARAARVALELARVSATD
jgi:hypothetical protein